MEWNEGSILLSILSISFFGWFLLRRRFSSNSPTFQNRPGSQRNFPQLGPDIIENCASQYCNTWPGSRYLGSIGFRKRRGTFERRNLADEEKFSIVFASFRPLQLSNTPAPINKLLGRSCARNDCIFSRILVTNLIINEETRSLHPQLRFSHASYALIVKSDRRSGQVKNNIEQNL